MKKLVVSLACTAALAAAEGTWLSDFGPIKTTDRPAEVRAPATPKVGGLRIPNRGSDRSSRARATPSFERDDMMAQTIDSIASSEQPNQWLTIRATVRNVGTDSQLAGVPVKLHITGPSGYTYEDLDEATHDALGPNDWEQVTFSPGWRAPDLTGDYAIEVWTDLPGDQNRANDTARLNLEITNWLTYADWNDSYWISWLSPQRGTLFYANDFGVAYPFTVESLKHEFIHDAGYPWPDSSFRFRIYGNSTCNLLYASPVLVCTCALGTSRIITHRLLTPVTITSGLFLVTIGPISPTGHPSSLADRIFDWRSAFGDTTGWFWWDLGEFHTACFVNWTAPANDVGVRRIEIPWQLVEPGTPIRPQGVLMNYGTNNQIAVPCSCFVVDSATDARIYAGYGLTDLNAGDTAHVGFDPPWTPPAHNDWYEVLMKSLLPGDANPENDTQVHEFFAFHVQDPLTSYRAETTPVIDGVLAPGEWDDAGHYDISNVTGRSDPYYRYYPGNVWLYAKHDSNCLYMAYDVRCQNESSDSTELGIYFDDDNDGRWNLDSSEGSYLVLHHPHQPPPIDSIFFRRILPGPTVIEQKAVGAQAKASYARGHEQFEVRIPIGVPKCSLNVDPNGDTCGFRTFFLNGDFEMWPGYWKTTMDPAHGFDPSYYGKLALTIDLVGIAQNAGSNRLPFDLSVFPCPTVRLSNIRYVLPKPGDASLKLYDVAGKLVTTLATGYHEAGSHRVSVDCGRLARGVYILRVEAGGQTTTRKLIVE